MCRARGGAAARPLDRTIGLRIDLRAPDEGMYYPYQGSALTKIGKSLTQIRERILQTKSQEALKNMHIPILFSLSIACDFSICEARGFRAFLCGLPGTRCRFPPKFGNSGLRPTQSEVFSKIWKIRIASQPG